MGLGHPEYMPCTSCIYSPVFLFLGSVPFSLRLCLSVSLSLCLSLSCSLLVFFFFGSRLCRRGTCGTAGAASELKECTGGMTMPTNFVC